MFQVQKELAGHEAVIVALFEEEKMSSFVQELDKAFEGQLQVLLEEKELSMKKKAISKVHSLENKCETLLLCWFRQERVLHDRNVTCGSW